MNGHPQPLLLSRHLHPYGVGVLRRSIVTFGFGRYTARQRFPLRNTDPHNMSPDRPNLGPYLPAHAHGWVAGRKRGVVRGMALDGHGAVAAVDCGWEKEVIVQDGGGRELSEGPVAVVGEGDVGAGWGLGAKVVFAAFYHVPVGVPGDGAGEGQGGGAREGGVGEGGM